MLVKGITDEDFINYKKPSMYIAFPFCTFKCEKECGMKCCQNSDLFKSVNIDISYDKLVNRYLNNTITKAVVCCGMDPIDSFDDLIGLLDVLRTKSEDDVVIYTGYNKEEIIDKLEVLKQYNNIIVKFGRYIPNRKKIYDNILGIDLASDNQYAEKIS